MGLRIASVQCKEQLSCFFTHRTVNEQVVFRLKNAYGIGRRFAVDTVAFLCRYPNAVSASCTA
jgi:hypothetical protein